MANKTILVCIGKRRRPVTLASSASISDLKAIILSDDFSGILPPNSSDIVLQIQDESWGLFVDLQKDDDLKDRSVINVVSLSNSAVDEGSASVPSEVMIISF